MKALDTSKPHLIITVGIPGSGKSFFAEHFAETFKAPLVSFDRLHQDVLKKSKTTISDLQAKSIVEHMFNELLKTNRTIVYEGKTNLRTERAALLKSAKNAGYEPLFIWVQTEPVTAKKRAIKKSNEKPLSSEQFDARLKQFSAPHVSEKFIVISGKHTYASQLKIILKHLVKPSAVTDSQLVRPPVKRNYLIR